MERIMKLVKIQKEMLKASLEVFDTHGDNLKPITINPAGRLTKEDNYSGAYTLYSNKMEDLIDAGLIVPTFTRGRGRDNYAYINLERIDEIRELV
jgi:alpha-galactosidase/6-phospho-beta-glucosidase family protein